jgi:hypothetical protein
MQQNPYFPENVLEAISTTIFLGSVISGFLGISFLLLYNMFLVLFQEAVRQPVIAALYILGGLISLLFVVDCVEKRPPSFQDNQLTFDEDPLPLPFEEDPAPVH